MVIEYDKSISSSVAQKQILIHVVCLSSRNGNRVRQIDIELGCPETNIAPDYQTSFAYRAGMVIEYDKSISSSVAQKQILIRNLLLMRRISF